MKKKIMLLCLLCATSLLLVGCGEKDKKEESTTKKEGTKTEQKQKQEESGIKSLSCTFMDESDEDMSLYMSMDFDYDTQKKEVISGRMKTTFKLTSSDVTDEDMEMLKQLDFCDDDTFSDFKDYSTSCNTDVNGTTITSVVELDVDKLEKASDDEDTFRKDMTLEELKEALSDEYNDEVTCTIK